MRYFESQLSKLAGYCIHLIGLYVMSRMGQPWKAFSRSDKLLQIGLQQCLDLLLNVRSGQSQGLRRRVCLYRAGQSRQWNGPPYRLHRLKGHAYTLIITWQKVKDSHMTFS